MCVVPDRGWPSTNTTRGLMYVQCMRPPYSTVSTTLRHVLNIDIAVMKTSRRQYCCQSMSLRCLFTNLSRPSRVIPLKGWFISDDGVSPQSRRQQVAMSRDAGNAGERFLLPGSGRGPGVQKTTLANARGSVTGVRAWGSQLHVLLPHYRDDERNDVCACVRAYACACVGRRYSG